MSLENTRVAEAAIFSGAVVSVGGMSVLKRCFKHPIRNGSVPSKAMLQPVGNTGDGGCGYVEFVRNIRVRLFLVKHFHYLPTIGKFLDFGHREEIAEKVCRLLWRF